MAEFLDVVQNRRSANVFKEGVTIPRDVFEQIFENLSLAPSCFNLQHAHYYVGESKEVMEELYEAAYKQYKVKTSSATIIVTGDIDAYKKAHEIYESSKLLKIIDEDEYNNMIAAINGLYESRGMEFQVQEAIRNASLSSMLFMLLAKNLEWDTCPMIYFDNDKVKEIFDIPENEIPILMITMGKMDQTSFRVRGYRKPSEEYVKFK
ncbi:nitroreductase family protein [Anaeromicropila herbilytica]|uniref:Nitroreductase n=1 Tax=Anaeromicropila herbilytica TaxID=2785025 RepID=A0A7R7ENR9_9FIRM|nr:nitroreductase family protein [Anaeromicropila herbilytica]BCN32187.1 nitroreductase [Anaeromicropila herbilytica]